MEKTLARLPAFVVGGEDTGYVGICFAHQTIQDMCLKFNFLQRGFVSTAVT